MSVVVIVDVVSLTRADRRLLEELKLRVSAVELFREREGRLPEESELRLIWSGLPERDSSYVRYDYHISKTEVPMPRRGGPVVWPASGGWALWVWLGESSEFYTSWDRRYSVEQSLPWFAIEGWWLFSPVIAVLLLVAPQSLRKKKMPNQVPEPTSGLAPGRGSS
jgi:hypothetical protein